MLTFIRTNENDVRDGAQLITEIYESATPARPDDLAHKFFARMGLDFNLPPSVRVHPSLNYSMGTMEFMGLFPALVLPKRDGAWRLRGVEMIYLQGDAKLAPVVDPYTIYWLHDPEDGTFMAVHEPVNGVYGVAKGLMSALAANHFTGIPMCAVEEPKDLEHFQIPDGVTFLVIFATEALMPQATALANRAEAAGIATRIVLPETPTATWAHEFALRDAIPVDDIAERKALQGNDNPSTKN